MSEHILSATALTYLPALVRLTALAMTLPVISGRVVPIRLRFAFVFALALIVIPSLGTASNPETHPVAFGLSLVHEVLIGALMGLSLNLMLAAVHVAGALIEGLCGFSMASFGVAPDPDAGQGVFARLFWWTTVAVFVASGGLNLMVGAVMESFVTLPPGAAALDRSMLEFLVQALGQSFEFGVMTALPAIAALLVASMVLGMAQKNFPQLGGMQVGLGIKAICGMLAASLVLISLPWMIRSGVDLTTGQLQELIQQVSAGLHNSG